MTKHTSREIDETKKKILRAAKKEFAERGFSGARMSSIAAIAGVNQALLHYHFESKENLYRSIFENNLRDIPNIFARVFTDEIKGWEATPDIKLCAGIYIMVGLHTETHDDDLDRIFAREIAEGKGILHEFVKKYILPRLLLFEDIIKEGVEKGIFETSNTLLITMCIVAFIDDFAHGEEFLQDTKLYNPIYSKKKETLYNFMLELAFKSLRPSGKKLDIPVLDKMKKERLDAIIADISRNLLIL